MPRVKLDYVVSFSSEDTENPASNLLAYEVSKKKWLCNTGEPSCSVVLQLTRAVKISTVHIGAYHAALVEVLVGRSETPNDQYEVLVPSSVFLSPMDSRRGSGVERVRSFSAEQLAPARSQRWDRVRVVCSQPYNKHCKYGLSFVHIFESEDQPRELPQSVAPAVPARVTLVGNYSSDEDEFKPGELFAKHLQRTSEAGTSKNTEAQIRQASSQALRNITDSSTKLVKTPISKTSAHRPSQANDFNPSKERNTLMYTDDDDRPNAKIDSIVQRHKNEKEQESKKKEAVQNLFKKDKHANILETASKNFKEFLNDGGKDLNSSRDKDRTSKDDRHKDSRDNDRRNKDQLDHSRSHSSKDDDRRNKDKLNNSRSKDSRADDRRNKDNLNNSRSKHSRDDDRRNKDNQTNSRGKESFRDKDRRDKDDEKASQSRTNAENGSSADSRKRRHSDDTQKTKDVLRPGPVSAAPHTLLRHVVFALSGYENPRRGRIRDAAVAMGARFERDWNPTCTHLICAFPNTPKLRTVRSSAQGSDCIAVLGEWVEQCCEKRRLLPWQWFATEPKKKVAPPAGWDDDKTASECDTDDEIEKVLRKQKKQRTDRSPSPQPHNSRAKSPKPHSSRERSPKPQNSRERSPRPQTSRERSPKSQTSRERSPKPQTSRERSPKPQTSRERSPKRQISTEISLKLHTSREKSPKPHTSRDRSPHRKEKSPRQSKHSLNYSTMSTDSDVAFVKDERIQANITIDSGDSTDEEKPAVKEKVDKKNVLPGFFEGYTFVIDDGVEEAGFDKELLSRYVRAYGGLVIDASQLDFDSEINYVLSTGGSALPGRAVRADWLWRCHRERRLCDVGEDAL